jgi:methylglutaconyl-CoA hydratase
LSDDSAWQRGNLHADKVFQAEWRASLSNATISVADEAGIRAITLNRPERSNAMTPEMQEELISAMEEATADRCRVVVLRGAGEAFCSGLDLEALHQPAVKTAADHHADAERITRLFRTLYELPMPTIAAVHGAAIAGGAGLAILCDFTLAVPAAKFGFPEVRIGFVPALVSVFLALQLGDKRTRDLLLTGRHLDAEEAYRLGIVNEIVAPEALMERVRALVHTLTANSPESLAATKRLMIAQHRPWVDSAIALAIEASARARETEDFREGLAAYLEKRKPVWRS